MVAAMNLGSVVILGILALVLGTTITMATRDGARDLATMRAIGYRPRQILVLVVAQGVLVALLGALLGLSMAPAGLELFSRVLADYLGGSWDLALRGSVVAGCAAAALAVGAIAAGLPAWRCAVSPIADALRRAAA
jgi:putative ABC transport system permease protein